jgi:hypothetical protein
MPQLSRSTSIATVPLGFEQTVPRSLVHKRSLENVLLTDLQACGDDRFICAGHVPIAHRFFNQPGRTPQNDILFYTELGRQASLAISHAFLDVSKEDVFVFEQSDAALTDAAWQAAAVSPLEPVVVEIHVREIVRRKNNAVSRVVADHLMTIGGEEVFHGTGAWTVQPSALFQRLRRMSARTAPTMTVPDDEICVDRPERGPADNLVITTPGFAAGSGSLVATLIVDHSHPYFFDHPCDHVPGMLLLEGCAQLAQAAVAGPDAPTRCAWAVRSYDVNFAQFVECGVPTTLTARVRADHTVEVSISQQNVQSGTTTMRLAFPA